LLASFLILCTWIYNYYTKDKVSTAAAGKVVTVRSEVTRDSLLRIYTSTIQDLESKIGNTYTTADSAETTLSLRLDEYYRLKDELATLLKNPSSNDDFKTAKQKINELQQKMQELRNTSTDVEQENARLYKLLAQINKDRKTNATQGVQNTQYVEGNKAAEKPYIPAFTTSEMSLASAKADEDEEQDVFSTQKKITGSFAVRNNMDLSNSEVMVVIIQPNGQVLQKSAWESGSFQSNDGKKIYSCKMSFPYSKGEVKKFSFSLNSEKFIKGNYTMQVYHNGMLIGRITKMLS
jgi:regulator of replication initiation timing